MEGQPSLTKSRDFANEKAADGCTAPTQLVHLPSEKSFFDACIVEKTVLSLFCRCGGKTLRG